jgi:hypothetical protein
MNVKNALTAGFVATVVLSVCQTAAHAAGLLPTFDLIGMIANIISVATGGTPNPVAGWAVHFIIGTILWGIGYAIVEASLPGPPAVRGMVFSAGAWLLMMIIVMPITGAGMFGLSLGPSVPVAILMLHLIFGATLGIVYAKGQGGAARDDVIPR